MQWAAVNTCRLEIKVAPQYWPEPEVEGRNKAASHGQAFFFDGLPPTILVLKFLMPQPVCNNTFYMINSFPKFFDGTLTSQWTSVWCCRSRCCSSCGGSCCSSGGGGCWCRSSNGRASWNAEQRFINDRKPLESQLVTLVIGAIRRTMSP